MEKRFNLLGLGITTIDEILYVDNYPTPDGLALIGRRERRCGGLTATALVAASRLGARCAYAGALGEDDDSIYVLRHLEKEGIDVSQVVRRDDARPVRATIIVAGKTRTKFVDLSGFIGAHPDRPDKEVIQSADVLFVDGFGMEGMVRAANIAKEEKIPVVGDFERGRSEDLQELLDLVDHLILSISFSYQLTGAPDPAGAVRALWDDRRAVVVVTKGREGAWSISAEDPENPVHQTAFPVEEADTTGCGDVFHGAYAAELARESGLEDRIRIAAAAAALKAHRGGGHEGIPSRDQVLQFLKERCS